MSRKLLSVEWETYVLDVLPLGASTVQISETRRGFYAGAASLYKLLMRVIFADAEPTAADLLAIEALRDELAAFNRDVMEGKA
jgi:hypothetical protein